MYECIKDYFPLLPDKPLRWFDGGDEKLREENRIWNNSIKLVPTKKPIVTQGDIMIQMGKNDSRFLSRLNPDCALYEYTIKNYPDCFKEIK